MEEEFDHSVGWLEGTEGQRWERDIVAEWMEGSRNSGNTNPEEIMRHEQAKRIVRWADENDQLHGLSLMDAESLVTFYIGFGVGVQNAIPFTLGSLFQ